MRGLNLCDGMRTIFVFALFVWVEVILCVMLNHYSLYRLVYFSQIFVYSLLLLKSTYDLFEDFWNLSIYIFISRKYRWRNIIQVISILFLSTNWLLKLTLANVWLFLCRSNLNIRKLPSDNLCFKKYLLCLNLKCNVPICIQEW